MNLSVKQAEIVNTTEKYAVVVAGAGSGKTRILTERIKKLLLTCKRGEKVLAITFSNKAATELKERLLLSFSESQLEEQVYVGTIHNFCMELVLQRGATIGLSSDLHIFESSEDRFSIFKDALDFVPEMKQRYIKAGKLDQKGIREVFEALSKAKRNFKFPADFSGKPLSQRLYQQYNDLMLAQNAIDFDDILLYAYKILSEKESVSRIYQRIYKHICVDEAQDLNKSQYMVINCLAGQSSSILMVGDPNQAIYGFNGSSSRYMCVDFPKQYSAYKFTLTENYRSAKAVIDAAKIIEPNFSMDGLLPIYGECSIHRFDNEISEAQWIIEQLQLLFLQGHPDVENKMIAPKQCAVLARNKYVFSELERLLKAGDIDYHIKSSASQGLSSESLLFKVFDLSLRLLINSHDIIHLTELLRLLNMPLDAVSSFNEVCYGTILEEHLGDSAAAMLKLSWSKILLDNSTFYFNRVLDIFKEYCEHNEYFTDDNERLLIYNDYLAWVNRWEIYVKASSIDNRSLANMMRSIALGVTNIAKETGITLSTVHMSKGLEFDVVFIMGLDDGVFPDYRAINDESQLDEERHNMFVSITRSKRLCYLTYPVLKNMPWGVRPQRASRFIELLVNANYTTQIHTNLDAEIGGD